MRSAEPDALAATRARSSSDRVLFIVAAAVLLLGTQAHVSHHLSPKTGLGYMLGIAGGVMLLLQTLYSLRKRLPALRSLGSLPSWFQVHMLFGVTAPILILIHCGFSLGATNSNIALMCLLIVAGSGIFGRYFYSKIHQGLYGRKVTLAELQRTAQDLRERGTRLVMLPELLDKLVDEEQQLLAVPDWGTPAILLGPFVIARRYAKGSDRLRRFVTSALNVTAARHKAVATQRDRFQYITLEYVSRRMRATRRVAEFKVYERLFSVWHLLHVPLFLMLLASGIVHVISVHVY